MRTDQQNSHHSSANMVTGCERSPITSSRNATASGVTAPPSSSAASSAAGGSTSKRKRGVDCEIAISSSVISTGTSSNSGVDR